MKKLLWMGFCAGLVLPVCAQEVKPKAVAEGAKPAAADLAKPADKKGVALNAGADLRIRQEVIGNMPERDKTIMPTQNYIRFRPRAWGEVKNEDFKLYTRVADEMRYYVNPSTSNYHWPDELYLDNLYLDLYNLFGGLVDIRAGRQDFYGPNGPVYGAGRVICDGTPGDGSRTLFFDAVKATVKFDEKNALDVLAIYNSPKNPLSVGDSYPYDQGERLLTGGTNEKEWGGGLYFRSKEVAEVPFELYYLYKRETKTLTARTSGTGPGAIPDGRDTHTWGARVMPKITDTVSAEFEGAVQAGQKDSGASTSGYMGYGGLTYKPLVDTTAKPYLTGACYYLSGDKEQGAGKEDSGWDPLWARWPQFSELYVYNTIYGPVPGYWSNLIYPHVDAGVEMGPGHKVSSSLGPLYTAVEDNLGGGDGNLRGWLGMIRYDFPIFKNPKGRGELYGHVTAEVLDPGDYYTSDQWAYFLRWEINARF